MNTEITKTQYKEVVHTLKSEILRLTEEQITRKPQFKDAQRSGDWQKQSKLNPQSYSNQLTALHIIYNEFRNKPPHTRNDSEWKTDYYVSDYYAKFETLIKKVITETVEEVA